MGGRQLWDHVMEAIERLPAGQRAVIILRDMEGCEAEEACTLLGISAENQRVLLHRARGRDPPDDRRADRRAACAAVATSGAPPRRCAAARRCACLAAWWHGCAIAGSGASILRRLIGAMVVSSGRHLVGRDVMAPRKANRRSAKSGREGRIGAAPSTQETAPRGGNDSNRLLREAAWSRMFGRVESKNPFTR